MLKRNIADIKCPFCGSIMKEKGRVSYYKGLPISENTPINYFECSKCMDKSNRTSLIRRTTNLGYQRVKLDGKWYFFFVFWKPCPNFNPSYRTVYEDNSI